MKSFRTLVTATAAIALVGAPLFATEAIEPASATAATAITTGATTTVLRRSVGTAGRYDVRLVIQTGERHQSSSPGNVVRVEIGTRVVRATTGDLGLAKLGANLQVKEGTLTFRVVSEHAHPAVTITMSRIRPHQAPATKSAGSSSSTLPATGSTATHSTGSTSSTASTGSTGITGPPVAPVVPVAPAPLSAQFAPDGAPILALPAGFAPIINYTNLVKDYEFNGSSLPADWTASANSDHGMNTMYQPSQVTMTGSSVALTAINQPNGGQPTTSGWISTEGNYSLTHGLIDFSAKMPAGEGLWSGLWLDQPDNSNPWGEIDVSEMLLGNINTSYGSLHGWAPSDWGETQSTQVATATTGYNDYQVAWQPGLLTWAVNGIAFAQYSQAQAQAAGYPWVFDDGTGFYLIADLAVGTSSSWGGAPSAGTQLPSSVLLKSVKIWQ
jgi:hypothetical protein